MIVSIASYLIGGVMGFFITLVIIADAWQFNLVDWTTTNLGHSTWVFSACLGLFVYTLTKLNSQLERKAEYQSVVQLDQLSDVWIHLFVGIGVIWTAIGMRSALVTTLSVPDTLANDASQVLGRLVDGGILLALSTTIVGAIGGYLMRLAKTIYVGSSLTEYYQYHDRVDVQLAMGQLTQIETLLEQLVTEKANNCDPT